jgi:FkbM family methyltransferase
LDQSVRLTAWEVLRHPGLIYTVLHGDKHGRYPHGGWYDRIRGAAIDRVQSDFFAAHPDGLAQAGEFRLFVHRARHGVSAQVILFRNYEPQTSRLVRSLVTPQSLVVDVGANIGWFTLLTARHARGVWAIEPEPANVSLLRRSIDANDLRNVVVRQAAAGDRDGTTSLWLTGAGAGLHSIARQVGPTKIDVPCERLDTLFPEATVDLLKVDVEGAEPEVLAGASRLVGAGRIGSIIMEWNPGSWPGKMSLLEPFDAYWVDGTTPFDFRTRPPEGNILLRGKGDRPAPRRPG